jgi:Tol biopolymer transport system component/tRNA A-37 threonylcarbamoyl transferase component Bud32
MGEVYRARDTKLNRDVAVKVLAEVVATDPDRLARFRREAQVLASLNHPNIAHVYGVEDTSSTHGLVMELVEGPTLADRIAQGPIPLDDALSIGRQITDALEAAHEQGIIHRDLKPANIKVRNDGTVKVLDFGLAKLVDLTATSDVNVTASPTLSRHATVAGVILGTAAYMSPEQARGKAVDKRADIWAFGCVLFEMVAGRRAFGGDDVTETFAAIVRDQPDLSQVPAQLRRLLVRCFEKDPRRRLRDIGDVWTLLDDQQVQPQSVRLKPDATNNAPAWRRVVPWAVAAAAAIAALGVSLVHLTETRFVPRPVRFQLQVPDEAGAVTPALSPDGTRLAYRFGGQIWVRDLGSAESRAIAPTDRSIGRWFWSADSRFVVYAATGKLMRVPAAGGVPETVRDQPLIVGGGFGLADGGIVVSSASPLTDNGETHRIDQSGVLALPGVRMDLRGSASLLPDGKRFVYSVFEPEDRRGVYVASIDNAGAPERILPDASDVAYVRSVNRGNEGYLLLQRQDALVAVPVDAARLQARGEPIVLAKGVGGFAASAGDSLVYRAAAGRRLTWYDRKGTSTGTAWSPGAFSELALSPDGTRVVVVRTDGRPSTWIHEFARESSARMAPTLAAAIKPLWSPKADRILVVSSRSGGGQAEIFSVAADGGGKDELVFTAPGYPTSWSRDGRWLMCTFVNPRTKEDLWVTSADGAGKPEPFLVTDNRETDGAFSPDGRAVAYVSDESGTSNVYVRSFPASGGHKWQVSTAGGYQPRWRGDGKELFYMSPSGQLMSVDVTPGIAAAPSRQSPLFQTAIFDGGASVNNWYWDVTADGQHFLINTVIGGADPSTLNVVLNWQSGLAR